MTLTPLSWRRNFAAFPAMTSTLARITRSERNSHQLERNFAEVGRAKPRVAVTVDLLTTGFDAPDVKAVVFVRPVKSAILYKQMKGPRHSALPGHRQALLLHLRLHGRQPA